MSAADEPRHPHTPTPRERSPLVDRLLMSGLDEYFAGRYERAIQVWSRVFFIDRGHARARAYIDRARTAMAESQREAEACGGAPDAELEVRSLIGTIGPEPARSSAPDSRPPIHGALAAMPRRAEAMTRPPTLPVVPVRRGAKRGRVAHALLVARRRSAAVRSGIHRRGAGSTGPVVAGVWRWSTLVAHRNPRRGLERGRSGTGPAVARSRSVRRGAQDAFHHRRRRSALARGECSAGKGTAGRCDGRGACGAAARPGTLRIRIAMRCPKCQYLGFDGHTRCRNCGYDLSLSSTADVAPPGPPTPGPPAPVTPVPNLPLRSEPSAREQARAAIRQRASGAAAAPVREAFDLPLFAAPGAEDVPVAPPPPAARPPLAVRRPVGDTPRPWAAEPTNLADEPETRARPVRVRSGRSAAS